MGQNRVAAGWRPCLAPALLALLLAGSPVAAQQLPGLRLNGVVYVQVAAVAHALGDIVTPSDGSLGWRDAAGTLTLFADSADGLWQPAGAARATAVALSAPARRRGGQWYVPVDALGMLGARFDGESLALPGAGRHQLALPAPPRPGAGGRSEIADLGHGVPALRLFAAGAGGADAAVVEIADLDLLPLVAPAGRGAIDAALDRIGSDKPLLVAVSALQPVAWQAVFAFEQDGRRLEVRYPYRMHLLQGSSSRVAPGSPATAVVLLPAWFDLYRPIAVSWQGIHASITFRR